MQHLAFPKARRKGFTLIEIIVILIIIALLVVIIVPHIFIQVKVGRARREKADLQALTSAIEHYALDNGKVGGFQPTFADIRKYLDPATDVYKNDGKDLFGDRYGPFIIGERPTVPPKTATKLSSVAGPEFWSPFQ
jgi:prepilin-type N-terminal cleavage/methylation domain-containing protein